MMDDIESRKGNEIGTQAGITSASLPAGTTSTESDRQPRSSEPIVRAGNNFWTHPPARRPLEQPDVEAPVVRRGDQNNGTAIPVGEIEAILVEDPGIGDPPRNFSVTPEPEIVGDVAGHSRPEDVPVRGDACQTATVDHHDDNMTVMLTVVTIAALAWLMSRRTQARRR